MPGMNDIELKDCILVLVFVIILYLLYKTRNVEGFAEQSIVDQINDVYKVDIGGLRNVGGIANSLLQMTNNSILTEQEIAEGKSAPSESNTLTLPFNNVNINPMIPNKLNINSNVVINGKVSFTGSSNMMDMMPKGMILAWASSVLPKGWAHCDGQTYYLNDSKEVTLGKPGIIGSIYTTTPDLRGRFILGSGEVSSLENTDTTKPYANSDGKPLYPGTRGGTHTTTLNSNNLPDHTHYLMSDKMRLDITDKQVKDTQYIRLEGSFDPADNTKALTGPIDRLASGISGTPYSNMPPYYVLTYIMKI